MAGTIKRAAIVRQFNKPLRIEHVEIPEAGPGEVIVEVRQAACVTPICVSRAATGR